MLRAFSICCWKSPTEPGLPEDGGRIAPYRCNRERDRKNRTSRIHEDIQIAEEEACFPATLSRAGLGDIIFN